MTARLPYPVRYVPAAEAQVEAALIWWSHNRRLATHMLARELDAAFDQLALVPEVGRRVRLRGYPGARRLLLRGVGYHLYYVILEEPREVRVVYFHHSRRRPPEP